MLLAWLWLLGGQAVFWGGEPPGQYKIKGGGLLLHGRAVMVKGFLWGWDYSCPWLSSQEDGPAQSAETASLLVLVL